MKALVVVNHGPGVACPGHIGAKKQCFGDTRMPWILPGEFDLAVATVCVETVCPSRRWRLLSGLGGNEWQRQTSTPLRGIQVRFSLHPPYHSKRLAHVHCYCFQRVFREPLEHGEFLARKRTVLVKLHVFICGQCGSIRPKEHILNSSVVAIPRVFKVQMERRHSDVLGSIDIPAHQNESRGVLEC